MSTLTGTGALAGLAARRDKIMLPAWIYLLTAVVASTAYSFRKLYPTAAGRREFAAAAAHNPALMSLYGTLSGDSIGSLTAWRYGTLAALGAALMSIFIVIRHTRADEETGRLELVGSAAVGRHAALGGRPGHRDQRQPGARRADHGRAGRARAAAGGFGRAGRGHRRLRAGVHRRSGGHGPAGPDRAHRPGPGHQRRGGGLPAAGRG